MKKTILTILAGVALLGGWAYAQQTELTQHLDNVRQLQKMVNGPCPPSTDPGGAG